MEAVVSSSLAETLSKAFHHWSQRPCLGTFGPKGSLAWKTYAEVWQQVDLLRRGLRSLLPDLKPGAPVGMLQFTSYQFFEVDIAVMTLGLVSVPLQHSLDIATLTFCLAKAELRTLFLDVEKVPEWQSIALPPSLAAVVLLNWNKAEQLPSGPGVKYVTFEQLKELGSGAPIPPIVATAETGLMSIVFTSGTGGGQPKGVMLSDAWFNNFVTAVWDYNPLVALSFMPLTHNTGRMFAYVNMVNGGRVALHTREDMETLFDELTSASPSIIIAAPRFYNAMYQQYQAESSLEAPAQLRVKYRAMLGHRMQAVCCGGAAPSPPVMEFLRQTFSCIVTDGYGATECGGIMVNGEVLPNVDLKLVDVPELGYLTSDQPPRGEVCVRTKTMMLGYFGEAGGVALDADGYYHTGDVGMQPGPGKLVLIDRVKNVIKLSQGEYVAAQKVESIYEALDLIDQIMIHGDGTMDCVVAVIVPNKEKFLSLLRLPADAPDSELAPRLATAQLAAHLRTALRLHGVERGLSPWEIPQKFVLTLERFTERNGLMTHSMKLRRLPCYKRYATEIAALQISSVRLADRPPPLEAQHRSALVADVQALFAQQQNLELELVPLDRPITELGGDSLTSILLTRRLSQRYSVVLSPTVIQEKALSLSQLADLLLAPAAATATASLQAEVARHIDSLPPRPGPSRRGAELGPVLVTGATGFLGRHVLAQLLAAGRSCLAWIRPPHSEVQSLPESCPLSKFLAFSDCQVTLRASLPGAAPATHLTVLCTEALTLGDLPPLRAVVHIAANTSNLHSYEALAEANIDSVVRLASFCLQHSIPLFHTSTAGILGTQGDEATVIETFDADRLAAMNGYTQTKWAECVVRAAFRRGLRGLIFRPGMIAPSRDGSDWNTKDWVWRYIRGSLLLKSFPPAPEHSRLDWTPVDCCAELMLRRIQAYESGHDGQPASPRVVHLVSGPAACTKLSEVPRALGVESYVEASHARWLAKLQAADASNPLLPFLDLFSAGLPDFSTSWAATEPPQAWQLASVLSRFHQYSQ